MSVLGHVLEEEGLATTCLALVRLHAEKVKPPRALWVPFELGRPLGPPNNPELQRRVLEDALALLESSDGPTVLVDFEYEGDGTEPDETWQPPIGPADPVDFSDTAGVLEVVRKEISSLKAFYEDARSKRGRTSVGIAKLDLAAMSAHVASYLDGPHGNSPRDGLSAAMALRFSADDLQAYYLEAAAHSGQPTSWQLGEWLWRQTALGAVFVKLRSMALETDDRRFKIVGSSRLIPSRWVQELDL